MMCSMPRLFGWTPPHNEDYVDLLMTSDHARPRIFTSEVSQESNTPAPFSNADVVNDKQPSSCKWSRDPNWVARPRNEFILFRCEFVRNHSRESKLECSRPTPAEGQDSLKTLSKQAAEAWYHLSPEERLYWKDRAIRERKEHARKYPDYRYRPRKSTEARSRSFRSFAAQIMPSSCAEGKIEKPIPHGVIRHHYQQMSTMHSLKHYIAHRGGLTCCLRPPLPPGCQ